MKYDDEGWEERMAIRARQRAALKVPAPGTPISSERSDKQQPWMHGWPRSGSTIRIGTETRCVCCGNGFGVTCTVYPPDWEPPGPEPDWPFSVEDCPLGCGQTPAATQTWSTGDDFNRIEESPLGPNWTTTYRGFGVGYMPSIPPMALSMPLEALNSWTAADIIAPVCPDCSQKYGPEAHVCPISGGTRCPKCGDLYPDNEVMNDVCIDCYERKTDDGQGNS